MCVLLFDACNGCSLVKKWIGKGMSNIYYWEKLTFSKIVEKVNFSERKFEKCTSFEEQKVTRYIRGNVCFGIIASSCLSSTKACPRELSQFVQKNKLRHPKQRKLAI